MISYYNMVWLVDWGELLVARAASSLKVFNAETENITAPFLFLEKKPASWVKETEKNNINMIILSIFKVLV